MSKKPQLFVPNPLEYMRETERSIFLKSKLELVNRDSPGLPSACQICGNALTDPVRIPVCGCVYDHACLYEFLNLRGQNYCPDEGRKQFDIPATETMEIDQRRWNQVKQAVDRSGLKGMAGNDYKVYAADPPSERLRDLAIDSAKNYLASQEPSLSIEMIDIQGPAVIHIDKFTFLNNSFVIMANMIPALAAVQGREFELVVGIKWEDAIEQLWLQLLGQHGQWHRNGKDLVGVLRTGVHAALGGWEHHCLGLSPSQAEHLQEDLEIMLRYLSVRCMEVQHIEYNKTLLLQARAKSRITKRKSLLQGGLQKLKGVLGV